MKVATTKVVLLNLRVIFQKLIGATHETLRNYFFAYIF